jgi:hypothetical protein
MDARAQRYLRGIAQDGVNDIPLRQRLRRAGGYCQRHAVMFAENSLLLPTAILIQDILQTRLERIARGSTRPIVCQACQVEEAYAKQIIQFVKRKRKNPEVQAQVLALPWCFAHLEALAQVLPKSVQTQLVDRFAEADAQLSEVIRKHDYRFTHETISEPERDSVRVVLEHLTP